MKRDNTFIKKCIVESLVQLMKEKDFKDITITEITKKAGVSRMSYYRNYYFKEDILNNYMNELIEGYEKIRNIIIEKNKNCTYPLILHVLRFFDDNKNFVIALEKSNLSNIIQNRLNVFIEKTYPFDTTESKYNSIIFSGALYNMCKTWILTGSKEDSNILAEIFVERMFPEEKIDRNFKLEEMM